MTTEKTEGKLLILLPGVGAVSSTLMAGVELARKGLSEPVGSLTQLASLPGRRSLMSEDLGLASLDDIAFAGWDLHGEDGATIAKRSEVLSADHFAAVEGVMSKFKPMPAVHDPEVVRKLEARDVCKVEHRREQTEVLREDIRRSMKEAGAGRAAAVLLTSTEVVQQPQVVHGSLKAFEAGLDQNDSAITPTQLYAYACLKEQVPFANGTPNMALDLPALQELSKEMGVAVAGRDLKTGQTLMKTVIAPALRARMLGVQGWFSTNILGNRDGEVLDDFDAFRSKEVTKRGCLEDILEPDRYPNLYKSLSHKVEINFYPPRGDNKEGWDNIDMFGWLGYPMQLKVNFLCRDSILAAPLALDLALLLDYAQRSKCVGTQEWLSFYFKAPLTGGNRVEHDLFAQLKNLNEQLCSMAGV